MRINSTTDAGNLSKAGRGTRRYIVTFTLTKDGNTETIKHAWRAPTTAAAIDRVKKAYKKAGSVFKLVSATEISGSYKA